METRQVLGVELDKFVQALYRQRCIQWNISYSRLTDREFYYSQLFAEIDKLVSYVEQNGYDELLHENGDYAKLVYDGCIENYNYWFENQHSLEELGYEIPAVQFIKRDFDYDRLDSEARKLFNDTADFIIEYLRGLAI